MGRIDRADSLSPADAQFIKMVQVYYQEVNSSNRDRLLIRPKNIKFYEESQQSKPGDWRSPVENSHFSVENMGEMRGKLNY